MGGMGEEEEELLDGGEQEESPPEGKNTKMLCWESNKGREGLLG